jgi:hypothetical protein
MRAPSYIATALASHPRADRPRYFTNPAAIICPPGHLTAHMMLSTISHSMPPSFELSPAPPPDMTTSLPIIPCKPRPKLSVNTSTPRSFGKGASLRLDTLSAVSPTKINTFSNAYPTLERPSKPRLSIDSNFPAANSASASASATPSSASTVSSALTASSSGSATISIPYKQPHNVVSILSNSQIVPRRMASSRPMFPAEKRVSFRTPLEEEITTTRYTLAHSDLESSVSTITSIASSTSTHSDSSATSSNGSRKRPSPPQSPSRPGSTFTSLEGSPSPKAPRVGDKRDSSSSEDESDTCPVTPVAGRRKRTRDWRWTLGTVPGSSTSASSTSGATTSEDSS